MPYEQQIASDDELEELSRLSTVLLNHWEGNHEALFGYLVGTLAHIDPTAIKLALMHMIDQKGR